MPVLITGFELDVDQIAEIARNGAKIQLDSAAVARITAARGIVQGIVDRGEMVYGLTSSVGAKTNVPIDPSRISEFNRRLLETHNMGHGPVASHEDVRAMQVVLLNSMASGRLGVRPVMAEMLVESINSDRKYRIHVRGSMGQSDMSPVADLALDLYDGFSFEAGEALALLNSSCLAIGTAALAIHDLTFLLDYATLVSALSMEGFAANPSIVSEAALMSRDFSGLQTHGARIRGYLKDSYLFTPEGPRRLQDPLCFRSIPQIHGTAADSLAHATRQVNAELRSSQNNPVVSIESGQIVSVANFDMVALAMALDIARLGFAPLITSSAERLAKLADSFWSGLSVGLIQEDDVGLPGFNGLAQVQKAITSEARLLTAPVVSELASSSHSNGNLDRASMSGLAARRAAELATLMHSIISMEHIVAAQAVELRGKIDVLGVTTRSLFDFVRSSVAFAQGAQRVPHVGPFIDKVLAQRGTLVALI